MGDQAEDDHVVAFATRWLPYGGARRSDIFLTFGVTPTVFGERLHAALGRRGEAGDHAIMLRRYADRLRFADPRLRIDPGFPD